MSAATLFPADVRAGQSLRSDDQPGFVAFLPGNFDAGDLRAVALTFVVTAALVLLGAGSFDVYLVSVLRRPVSLDGLMTYRLAADMLPWSCGFTCAVAGALAVGLAAVARRPVSSSTAIAAGFGRAF